MDKNLRVSRVAVKALGEIADFNLACVGSSIQGFTSYTLNSLSYLASADIVYFYPPSTDHLAYMREVNDNVIDLFASLYCKGSDFQSTYQAIIETIIESVRSGKKVAYASQGSPVFLSYTSIAAYRTAISQGYRAIMVPGVSSFELLICELCKQFNTYDIQIYNASTVATGVGTIDPHTPCLIFNFERYALPAIRESTDKLLRLHIIKLIEKLRPIYPPNHIVLGIRISPSGECQTLRTTVADLEDILITSGMKGTLFLPAVNSKS